MTRETKVGLVVSCSFLCLVSTVVYVKYKSPDPDTAAMSEDAAQMIPPDPTPMSPQPSITQVAVNTPNETESKPSVFSPPSANEPEVRPATSETITPPPPAPRSPYYAMDDPSRARSESSSEVSGREPGPLSTATPESPNENKKADMRPAPIWEAPDAKGPAKDIEKSPPDAKQPDALETAPPAPTPPTKEMKEEIMQTPSPVPAANPADNTTAPAPTPIFQTPSTSSPTTSPLTAPSNNDEASLPAPAPATNSGHIPFPPPPPPDEVDTKPSPAGSAPTFTPSEARPSQPSPAPSPGPMNVENSSRPDTNMPKPAAAPPSPVAMADSNVRLNPPIANNVAPPSPPGSSLPVAPGEIPPVGANGTRTSPPIAVPVPPSSNGRTTSNFVPQVESYDEETYRCKAGDTLENVSQRYYANEKYARALLLFNRNHPRPATGLASDPPQLVDGQPLYIPPPHILDKYYAYAVPGQRISPSLVVPASATTLGAPNTGGARAGQRYTVRQPEMVSAIARTTLGNLERWSEIYELNGRGFDPSRPIPAGTVLVMPADAVVSSQ